MNADKNKNRLSWFPSALICVYLRFQIYLSSAFLRFGVFELRFFLVEYFALEDPHFHADLSVGGRCLGKPVVDIGAQRMQRHTAFAIPLRARDLGAVQAPGDHDLDAERAQPHGIGHGSLHGAAEHNALFELLRDIFRNQLRVQFRLAHFLYRQGHRHARQPHQFLAQFFNVLTLLTDDDTRPRGVDRNANGLRRPLDDDRADRRVRQLSLQKLPGLEIGNQIFRVRVVIRVPTRAPVANYAEPEPDRIDLLSHLLASARLRFITDNYGDMTRTLQNTYAAAFGARVETF